MTPIRLMRSETLTINEQVDAVFRSPVVYELGSLIPTRQPVGRPANNPPWLLLAYGVLARVFRSAVHVEVELARPDTWQRAREVVAETSAAHPELAIPEAGLRPPTWDAWRSARNTYFAHPEMLGALRTRFTELAVTQARAMGLLNPAGPGSLSHPDRSRTVYGDGTVVKTMYDREVADPESTAVPPGRVRRVDRDAADHHGHGGTVYGQNFVAFCVRGDRPHERVVLAVDRVPRPGREADTAVGLAKQVHAVAGTGVQALVYDGALRGRHVDELMTRCGWVVLTKVRGVHSDDRNRADGHAHHVYELGPREHATAAGRCGHDLAAVDGAVCEIGWGDYGQPVVLHRLERRQVKRPRRATGSFHFNVAYEIPCPHGSFLAWICPHASPNDARHRQAEAVRVIAEGEPDFMRLYPLRSDSEAFNAALKRTLLVDRAMSLGGNRQLLDMLCFAILHNAITAWHHGRATSVVGVARGRR